MQVSVGKRVTPLVRTLRRDSNDYLSVNIDSESDRFIDKQETIEDKGMVLNISITIFGLNSVLGSHLCYHS